MHASAAGPRPEPTRRACETQLRLFSFVFMLRVCRRVRKSQNVTTCGRSGLLSCRVLYKTGQRCTDIDTLIATVILPVGSARVLYQLEKRELPVANYPLRPHGRGALLAMILSPPSVVGRRSRCLADVVEPPSFGKTRGKRSTRRRRRTVHVSVAI